MRLLETMAEECHKTTLKRRASHHGARRRRISDDQGRGIDHWTGGNTLDQRTGTTHRLSGTVWAITGTTGAVAVEDILARLPKLRKDARANVESVLHELIADKTRQFRRFAYVQAWRSGQSTMLWRLCVGRVFSRQGAIRMC